MSSIHQFKSALRGGGARSNRFECIINVPLASADVINNTRFLVSSTQIPGSTLGTIEQPFRGRFLKLAQDANNQIEQFSVTFEFSDIEMAATIGQSSTNR